MLLTTPTNRSATAPTTTRKIIVTIYTEALSPGQSSWATAAALQLWPSGLFYDYGAAELAVVAWGDSYYDNVFACNGTAAHGADWSVAAADCWLANCSTAPAPGVTPDGCLTGAVVCEHGARACAVHRWQNLLWAHYLSKGTLPLQLYHCLSTSASSNATAAPNALVQACLRATDLGDEYPRLLEHYYDTFRATEATQYAATVMSTHVRRSSVAHPTEWPLVVLSSDDGLQSSTYAGEKSAAGLQAGVCAAYSRLYGQSPPDPCKRTTVASPSPWLCRTVSRGAHYASPPEEGFVSQPVRSVTVRLPPSDAAYVCNCTAEPYPICMSAWNKLWGASRCGDVHPHHLDSDRFVWRRHQGSPSGRVELAAYSYDGGIKPYSPPNPNLLQPFSSLLLADGQTTYQLRMELPDAGRTIFVLSDASGAELERKTVVHRNACADYLKGYQLSLYYGGQCTAPSEVEACYANDTRRGGGSVVEQEGRVAS